MGEALLDVRESTLEIRLDDEGVVFKVYKPLNTSSHYKYLCMIMMMEVEECGVETNPLKTSLDFLIELPKPLPKPKMMMIDKFEKDIIEKNIDHDSAHSRGQK